MLFHKRNAFIHMAEKELRGQFSEVTPRSIRKACSMRRCGRKLNLPGELVRLVGRGVVIEVKTESKKIIEAAFADAGLKVPALKDVLGLKVDKMQAQKIVTLLPPDQNLLKISDDLVFHRDALLDLRKRMALEKAKSPKLDVARFKDLTGVTRKYAIPLLEYLDREHVTRRIGDERVIL